MSALDSGTELSPLPPLPGEGENHSSSTAHLLKASQESRIPGQEPLACFYYKPAGYNNVGEIPLEVRCKMSSGLQKHTLQASRVLRIQVCAQIQILALIWRAVPAALTSDGTNKRSHT